MISKYYAKPFLKWAGGKTQLLSELENKLPGIYKANRIIERYVEPFLGGGAFFFFLKRNYSVKEAYLFDINREIIIGYRAIQKAPEKLIKKLAKLQKIYKNKSPEERADLFYKIRERYNKQMYNFDYDNYTEKWVERAGLLIFLNKTCFNGLFRQNKAGEFNVPYGGYLNPRICDETNLIEVHKALNKTNIVCADFTESAKYITKESLVYLDPPYLPISNTSGFTDYSKEGFGGPDHKRLSVFFKEMTQKGASLILSNSDPKEESPDNDFIENLYNDNSYRIARVLANRMINCNASRRGQISEVIVTNY